jgi:hypothetical protein
MICPRCQATMADNLSFCTNCGNQFGAQAAGSSSMTQPAQPPQRDYAPPPQPNYAPPPQRDYAPPPQSYNAPASQSYSAPPAQPGYSPQQAPPGNSPQGQPPYSPQGQPGSGPPAQHHGPPFAFDLKRLSRVDQVIGGASLVLIITLFLPWFGVFGFTVSGFSAHGYLFIPLLTAIILVGYLVIRAGWDDPPMRLPVAHAPLLLVGTGLQFLIVLLAFLFKPGGTSWQFGAFLALIAALVAFAAIVVPAVQSTQRSRPGN